METEPTPDPKPEPFPAPPTTVLSPVLRGQPDQAPERRPPTTRSLPPQKAVAPRDPRLRRTPPRLGRNGERRQGKAGAAKGGMVGGTVAPGAALKSGLRLSPSATPRSLLPATERKVAEGKVGRTRAKTTGQEDDKWDITPDGGSAGREGRQFAVWNVGNNGRIYLRPTVRPANLRYPQPHFVFPITPPSTASLDVFTVDRQGEKEDMQESTAALTEGRWTPTPAPPTLATSYLDSRGRFSRTRQRRAMSDSTIPDTSVARESDAGGFKIVITQPGEGQRPKTVEDIDAARPPVLDISIPSWKIGTPRFSIRGTPFIRGSSYAPTEEIRSSSPSLLNRTLRKLTPELSNSQRHSQLLSVDARGHPSLMQPRLTPALRSTYLSTHLVIGPAMFDALTFKPECDDRSIVRYSPSTGAVTAASPPRLVAEITSPSFLDYDLLSDFFLTFRSFLEPADLLRMLFARLQWALAREDEEIGTVVRVRTFVALRHWILNYFLDDFVVDHGLRVQFCELLNELVGELTRDPRERKPWMKILTELKKCWRRVCAQFWDGPEFDASAGPDVPISPGGIAGNRDSSLNPSIWERADSDLLHLDSFLIPNSTHEKAGFSVDIARPSRIPSVTGGTRPGTPENAPVEDLERTQTSPISITSVDVISCSFPTKNMKFPQPGANYPLAAHPVDPSSVAINGDMVAMTPRALVGKRVRPQHKRNGSLTDSLRDHAPSTERDYYKKSEFSIPLPYAGNLVRGNLFPPGQPFVEIMPPNATGAPGRRSTMLQSHPTESEKDKLTASAMSGQGMKRLLGSVRRALSTKGQTISQTQGNFINISPIGPQGATTNRLPGTAIVPQARLTVNGAKLLPVRIDLLGAEIVEDFKKAVHEESAAEAERQHTSAGSAAEAPPSAEVQGYSQAYADKHATFRTISDMAITTGSKSIVIVDDTLATGTPRMTGALPAVNPSAENFSDTFIPNGGNLTPPNTPPGHLLSTAQRSSFILSRQSAHQTIPAVPESQPSIRDTEAPAPDAGTARFSENVARPSLDHPPPSAKRVPLSGVRGHFRHPSTRTYRSNSSSNPRRFTSFMSGIAPQATIRSFDATTCSEGSVDFRSEVSVPRPLRVLRRRPGGDLRAVTNVGDLEPGNLRRPRSAGSLTTYTDSIRSSYIHSPGGDSSGFVNIVNSDYSRDKADVFSLGAIAAQPSKRGLSLFSTHSSKPVMRPSFEAEAKKLAQIPDDADDDGGVESALLKLEGKYQKGMTRLSLEPPGQPTAGEGVFRDTERVEHRYTMMPEKIGHDRSLLVDQHPSEQSPVPTTTGEGRGDLIVSLDHGNRREDVLSFLSEDSRDSYCSIPLLDRGLTDDGQSKHTATGEWANRSVLHGPEDDSPSPVVQQNPFYSHHPSYDFVKKTESLEKIKPGDTAPTSSPPRPSTEQSFLDVDSDDSGGDGNSDLSSELSADAIEPGDDGDMFAPLGQRTELPGSPMRQGSGADPLGRVAPSLPSMDPAAPPSPRMTLAQALQMSPPRPMAVPMLHDHQIWGEKPLPPTPETTPTMTASAHAFNLGSAANRAIATEKLRYVPKLEIPDTDAMNAIQQPQPVESAHNKYSVHLPFVLAFDSDVVAQQFTLIEKDALNEIDWKELIEMRWKNAEHSGINTRSWVSFLRDTDARGVEVVIARFNIMVKWAISEIVLTQDLEERASCIIKLIHIAADCRRYRNFATTSQLTIALTSNEIARLTRTWAMVPPADMETLRALEALISPTRNFYNLRREMEGGGSAAAANADMGCIPFVGIYTHDLLFNAQRPSEIASSPTTAPLVNFERCRIAAGVVKTLLRLLEASTLYEFQPIEGLTERCLWMGALTDEEIRNRSEALE